LTGRPLEPAIGKYAFYRQIGATVAHHHATMGWTSQRATLLAAPGAVPFTSSIAGE
jgi:hypothetical protein